MGKRLNLQSLLEDILGSEYVYFQPPESSKIHYPCIIYGLSAAKTKHADNKPYINTKRYQIKVIDRDPDSVIPDKISELPMCEFERHFIFENLHHDIYNLYY